MVKIFRAGDPRDILAAKWEIEFEETFHFKQLYKQLYQWLEEQGWSDPAGGKTWEYYYFERTLPSGHQEHRIWWRVARHPSNSSSDYVRYAMKIDFQTISMAKSETVFEGNKYKTYKGDVIVRCEAWLQLDYNNKWRDHPFLKYIDKFFRERIYKKQRETFKLDLYRKSYEFNREVKRFLDIKTPVKEGEYYRSKRGTPS